MLVSMCTLPTARFQGNRQWVCHAGTETSPHEMLRLLVVVYECMALRMPSFVLDRVKSFCTLPDCMKRSFVHAYYACGYNVHPNFGPNCYVCLSTVHGW